MQMTPRATPAATFGYAGYMGEPERLRLTLRFPQEVVNKLDELAGAEEARSGRKPSHNEIIQNLIADAAGVPLLAASARPKDVTPDLAIKAITMTPDDVGAVKLIGKELARSGQDRAAAVMFACAASLVLKQKGKGPKDAADELLHTARSLRVRDTDDGPSGENVELRIALVEHALHLCPGHIHARSQLGQWKLWSAQMDLRLGRDVPRALRRIEEALVLLDDETVALDNHAKYAAGVARLELATHSPGASPVGVDRDLAVKTIMSALLQWAYNTRHEPDLERSRWLRQVRYLRRRGDVNREVDQLLEKAQAVAPWNPVRVEEL